MRSLCLEFQNLFVEKIFSSLNCICALVKSRWLTYFKIMFDRFNLWNQLGLEFSKKVLWETFLFFFKYVTVFTFSSQFGNLFFSRIYYFNIIHKLSIKLFIISFIIILKSVILVKFLFLKFLSLPFLMISLAKNMSKIDVWLSCFSLLVFFFIDIFSYYLLYFSH